jgi:hypothetical protein
MGLLMDLPKEHNSLYHDFTDAYWAIAKVSFGSRAGNRKKQRRVFKKRLRCRPSADRYMGS